mmetsp:Transcript_5302/g.33312  ORF Transcript_5302/g.33312 Transcript_5302/m.33312 type:complete len:101 (+) Transcript_5302:212-514(+)
MGDQPENDVEEKTMYIRVKRKKMTVFLQVNPTDVVSSVKETLAGLVEKSSDDMRLWSGSVLLDENKSLEHFGIGNGAVLGLAYRSDTGEFEDVIIEQVDN